MKKLFICYWIGVDGGDRESYNVFYSEIVEAIDGDEALEKYFASGRAFAYDVNNPNPKEFYGAFEMKGIIK